MGSVTFSKLGQHGQLGNQLFQIAAVVGIAKKNGMQPVLPAWEYALYFPNYEVGTVKTEYQIKEPFFHHADISLDQHADVDLLGYFQSEKYWLHCEQEIARLFRMKNFLFVRDEPFEDKILHSSNNNVAMHVRRGDYVNNPNYYQLTADYYIKALHRLHATYGDLNVLCFSNDIEWCRHNLNEAITGHKINFVEGGTAIEDFYLGSRCDHFIIANSSFSWWMARLAEFRNPCTTVMRPEFWNDGDLLQHADEKDICPDRWEVVQLDKICQVPEVIDLSDVTFTIPVKFESKDRLDNFFLSLKYLNRFFKTNVIIGEQDKEYLDNLFLQYYDNLNISRLKYQIKDTFERTRLLNDMAHMATTPYIVNWDCDVFMHPEQILKAVQALRENKVDGVYPYDGQFLRVNRQWIPRFQQAFDVSIFKNVTFKEIGQVSFGGAIIWNREKFLEGGGENQYFVHYGPEDMERYERFKKLGYRIGRVVGALYHINHSVADNGANGHAYMQNNKDEYTKICNMSADALRAYVSYWPWLKQPWGDFYEVDETPCPLGLLQLDQTYVANLERRPERRESVDHQLKSIGFTDYVFVSAVDGLEQNLKHHREEISAGMVGCFETHKNILDDAIANNYNCILVLEDDIVLEDGFNKRFAQAWKTLPDDWQFIHLGHYEHGGMLDVTERLNKDWVIPKTVWGTHGYAIRGRETMIELRKAISVMEDQIDVQLFGYMRQSNIKEYAVFPPIINQDFARHETDVQVPQKQKLF